MRPQGTAETYMQLGAGIHCVYRYAWCPPSPLSLLSFSPVVLFHSSFSLGFAVHCCLQLKAAHQPIAAAKLIMQAFNTLCRLCLAWQGKSWTGKYEHDSLYGHKAGVKSLKLLPSHGMLLTGGQACGPVSLAPACTWHLLLHAATSPPCQSVCKRRSDCVSDSWLMQLGRWLVILSLLVHWCYGYLDSAVAVDWLATSPAPVLLLCAACMCIHTGSLDRTVRLWDLNYGMPLSISRPHGGTVRSVALDAQLVVSGSSDNVVRLWHARNSTHGRSALDPAAAAEASALLQDSLSGAAAATAAGPLGLAEGLQIMEMDGPGDADVDEELAAAIAAANAAAVSSSSSTGMGTRGGIPSTHGPYSVVTGDADDTLFDLSLPGQQLRGHIGPVTSLCLSDSCLYSGSWDYTVRCWRRGSWDCIRWGKIWPYCLLAIPHDGKKALSVVFSRWWGGELCLHWKRGRTSSATSPMVSGRTCHAFSLSRAASQVYDLAWHSVRSFLRAGWRVLTKRMRLVLLQRA